MRVIHVEERVRADGAHEKIRAVYISAGDIAETVLLEDHALVLVEVEGRRAVYNFLHTQPVSVIHVFDNGSVFRHGPDQLVSEIVGILLSDDRCPGNAVCECRSCGKELVSVTVVGKLLPLEKHCVYGLLKEGQAVEGIDLFYYELFNFQGTVS